MNKGDVVFAKSIPVCFENAVVRGTSTYKAPKGSVLAFLVLGMAEVGKMNDFDAVGVMKEFGWTPPADFAASHPETARHE